MRTAITTSRRSRTACSVIALATALVVGPSPAAAQSFQGTGTPLVPGSATITTPTGTTTNIAVNNAQTVIEWTPFDNTGTAPISFQAGGTTATFTGTGNYAVLNRIISNDPSRQVQMFGTVNSLICSAACTTGGSVYFYSPGGFLFGATSVINVGSLVVSASPIQFDANGTFITGARNEVIFGQALTPGATITTNTGAQFNALNEGSYVALVAPRVIRGGNIAVNGQAAIVAAEAATIRFSPDGLFDIEVTSGSSQVNGMTGGGDITGPASSGPGDNHRVYMVAVPKNQAISLAISQGSDLGFAIAGAADVVGNTIVLSAGHNIVGGAIGGVAAAGGAFLSNISVASSNFTSALVSESTGDSIFSSFGALNFASDVTAHSGTQIWLSTQSDGATIDVAGSLTLSANKSATAAGQSVTGGIVDVYTSGPNGRITVVGNVTLRADGSGGSSATSGTHGGSGTGGRTLVQVSQGGQINFQSSFFAHADGYGGLAQGAGVNGGSGTGGNVRLETFGTNSSLTIAGTTNASAQGWGGSSNCIGCNGLGGFGSGGTISISAGGTSGQANVLLGDFESDTNLYADGHGGDSSSGTAGATGTGGTVTVQNVGLGSNLEIRGDLVASATGFGGNAAAAGINGGIGDGGTIQITSGEDNASLLVTGTTDLWADGYGGYSGGEGCVTCNGSGGNGLGGVVTLSTSANAPGATLTFNNAVSGSASGYGGSGVANGGVGIGGGGAGSGSSGVSTTFAAGTAITYGSTLDLMAVGQGGTGFDGNGGNGIGGRAFSGSQTAATGGSLTVVGNASLDASGTGGDANGPGNGGTGSGGLSDNGGSAGNLDFQSNVTIQVRGTGGSSQSGMGGNATGGQGWIDGFGADVHVGGNVFISAAAQGGGGETGGGNANGGNVQLVASNAASLVAVDGEVVLDSGAVGGDTTTGNGGNAQANQATVRATNGGTLTVEGNLFAYAIGRGGDSSGANGVAGWGRGGNVQIFSFGASVLGITGAVFGIADGFGGYADALSGFSGDGFGGQVFLRANSGGSTTVDGAVLLQADGNGGNEAECSDCDGGRPGNGTGGTAQAYAQSAGSTLTVNNNIGIQANGYGSLGGTESFGNGTGGFARLFAIDGGTTVVTGNAQLHADGFGGDNNIGGEAGDGAGGTAVIFVGGIGSSNLSVGGLAVVSAEGIGGLDTTSGGEGGDGIGGAARIDATNGAINITGSVTVSAAGLGGDAEFGTGGDGQSGSARVTANNAAIHFFNTLSVNGSAIAGDGLVGGAATGLVSPPEDETLPISVSLFVNTGGSVTVDGATTLDASAQGGNGSSGNGGNATAGEVDVAGFVGNITLNALTINANANGGHASNGGNGGNAQGGVVDVVMGYTNQTVNGTLTIASAMVSANAFGGNGGDGSDGNFGGAGGNGGNATGGNILYAGSASGGNLISGDAILDVSGWGGQGGNGGSGDGGTGGDGGDGGNGTGGSILTGSISNNTSPTSGGSATYASLSQQATGQGGQGGNGGLAGGGDGNGGDGGNGTGGSSLFLARGVLVIADDVTLNANAGGGDGGSGTTAGAGGDATSGSIAVESKDRFAVPSQRGTLDVNSIVGTAMASAGIGSTSGTTASLGGSFFRVLNGDASIGSFSFTISGGTAAATADFVSAIDGAAVVDGTFSFNTSNNLILFASNGSLTATDIVLSAANFVADSVNEPAATPGTFFADTFTINTGNNFHTAANLDSVNLLEIIAPGSITANNIRGDAEVYLTAQGGTIDVNDIDAGLEVRLIAATGVTAGDILTDFYLYGSTGGQMTVGDVISEDETFLFGDLGVSYASITSGADTALFSNDGLITGGDINAGGAIYGSTRGSMDLGNLDSGDFIELFAHGDISLGNAIADEWIEISTHDPGDIEVEPVFGGFIDTGNLTAGDTIEVDAGTYADLGNLSAGIVNPSTNEGAEYNVGVLAGTNILAGNIQTANHAGLAAPGNVTAGNINVANIFMVLAGGNISLGAINAGANVYLADFSMMGLGGTLGNGGGFDPDPILAAIPVQTDGDITIGGSVIAGRFQAAAGGDFLANGDITSGSLIFIRAGGSVGADDLNADGSVRVIGGGAIALGDINAGLGIVLQDVGTGTPVEIFSQTSIATGDISTDGYVGLYSAGSIAVGSIDAGHDVIALAGTDAGFGAVTTPERFILAGYDNFDSLFIEVFDPELIFSIGTPAPTGGDATFDGTALVGNFEAYVGGDITADDIESDVRLLLFAGGGMELGDLNAGDDIDLEAGGAMSFGDVNAGTEFDFDAGESVSGGDILAGVTVEGHAEGALLLGDISIGDGVEEDDTFSVGITSATSILVGNVTAPRRVGFATLGDLTTGSLQSGWDVMLLAGGDVVTGSITSGEGDNVYIADASMCETGGGCDAQGETDFDPELVLAVDPVATGGSITIGGPVSTGFFRAAAGNDLTTGDIDADEIRAWAGGLATLDGLWSAGEVHLVSGDIDIGAEGGIDAGASGEIQLQAVSQGTAVIGDGVAGTGGYRLSNAEFGRISGGDITIVIGGNGGDADTLIGDLTVTGPLAGSNIESQDGGLTFITLAENGNEVDGTLRIVGEVIATGFGANNYIAFETQNFELDAATGLLSITGNGNALSGYISIAADKIHVAEGSLLDQLADDPQFDGYRDALNRPAATQRPDGVIRAAGIDIEFIDVGNSGPHTLFVQNMGTESVPAGFVVTDADIGDDGEQDLPAGSVDLVINGQIVTEGGTLTGVAVRDLLVAEFGTEIFVPGSTINGCELTGSCGNFAEEVPPAVNTTPPIIAILNTDPLGEMTFGNEPDIDDSAPGDLAEKSSPISPPQPLFDTSPLDPASDINDPVSGAGNPSLYGVSSDEDDDDDEEEEGNGKTGDGQKGGAQ